MKPKSSSSLNDYPKNKKPNKSMEKRVDLGQLKQPKEEAAE